MLYPLRTSQHITTARWMANPEELKVGDLIVEDYMNVRGLTVERVAKSEPGDGRHGAGCEEHDWLIAFDGEERGHCYTMGKATFRRVVAIGSTTVADDTAIPEWEDMEF